jgi:hypothetical protein
MRYLRKAIAGSTVDMIFTAVSLVVLVVLRWITLRSGYAI